MAYVPFFYNNPGKVSADTKAFLYLNPGHLLASAFSMWNADQSFGTVTHQNVGYLFPMGPYFWAAHFAHIPMWIAQRFWMGSLLFLAGLGVRKVAQEMGLSRGAGWAAAIPYALSPFIIVNIARTSAILMPWAGLGWMLMLAIRSARFGGWKNPARFAIIVALVGGVNATSILLVGLSPIAWLVYAAYSKEVSKKAATSAALRIGALSGVVSVWWLAGLYVEGKYGINILKYTETIPTVSSTSSSSEVFRGLGYWYFYGRDSASLWITPSSSYTSSHLVTFASYVVPILGVIAALVVRWRYRLFAVLTAFLGVLIAVGTYPYASPSPFGSVLKWFGENTTLGLAMRSTNRVAPIMILSLCLLVGAGFDALRRRQPTIALPAFTSVVLASMLALAPFFNGYLLPKNLGFTLPVPTYVQQAANDLNRDSNAGAVLGIPGVDFGFYKWGAFVDSAWPGLLNRRFVTNQITLQGEPASIDLVRAFDSRFQDLVASPSTIGPIARLLGATNLLYQFDTQYGRFYGPTPWYVSQLAASRQSGVTLQKQYGPTIDATYNGQPWVSETTLMLPKDFTWPKSLAVYHVDSSRGLVRTESNATPILVAGDGDGLVNMAEMKLLNTSNPIFYEGALTDSQVDQLIAQSRTSLVLTDTNQRRLNSYGTLHSSPGYIQTFNETPIVDHPAQQLLLAYPSTVPGAQTVAVLTGIKAVRASSYGNPIANVPEVQPYYAVDGNVNTGWQTAAFSNALGEYLQINFNKPLTFNKLHLTQFQSASMNRWITKATIFVDGKNVGQVVLNKKTRTAAGDDVHFPTVRGNRLRIRVDAVSYNKADLSGISGVGFAEVSVPGMPKVSHSIMMPTSMLSRVGSASSTNELSILMSRLRVATTPPRIDPQLTLDRMVQLPNSRTFNITGHASLQPAATDRTLIKLLAPASSSGVRITSTNASSHLVGSLVNGSWAAFDNDPSTTWMPAFQTGPNTWVEAHTSSSTTVHHVDIAVVHDRFHMIPTRLKISADNGRGGSYEFDTHLNRSNFQSRDGIVTLSIDTPALSGENFRLSVVNFDAISVADRISGGVNHPPIGISSFNLSGVSPLSFNSSFDSGCRSDLLTIDGSGVPVRVEGSTADALNQLPLSVSSCSTTSLSLTAGTHHISSQSGVQTGLNIDQLLLHSDAATAAPAAVPFNNIDSHWKNRWTITAKIPASSAGHYLAVGQSFGPGWKATLNGADLGSPTLIDGASLGWQLPSKMSAAQTLVVTWSPQLIFLGALFFSGIGLLLCLFLAMRRAPRTSSHPEDATPAFINEPLITRQVVPMFLLAITLALCVSWWLVVPLSVATLALYRYRIALRLWSYGVVGLLIAAALATTLASHQDAILGISWPSRVLFANGLCWTALAGWVIYVVATSVPPIVTFIPVGSNDAPSGRRRGLNVPETPEFLENEAEKVGDLMVAPRGFWRSVALLRASLARRRNPELYQQIVRADTLNQVTGNMPLFNRTVLEIADSETTYAEVFAVHGAHVVRMRRMAEEQRRGYTPPPLTSPPTELLYTPLMIPAEDKHFDVVFATNLLSSVDDPFPLINELVRVTKPGGALFLQNALWYSPWGGRETSPWHLISGTYARRRYQRLNGHDPHNAYGVNFFKMHLGETMRALRDEPRLAIVSAGPRYLPPSFGWILRVPVLRDLVTINVSIRLERLQD